MGRTRKERPMHYRKRKDSNSPSSARTIAAMVTGIDKDDLAFDAAWARFRYLVKKIQKLIGYESGLNFNLHPDDVESFVTTLKTFDQDERASNLLKKLTTNGSNELTVEDYEYLAVEVVAKPLLESDTIPDDKKKALSKYLQEYLADDFWEKVDQARNQFNADIKLLMEINDYESRLIYIDEYIRLLQQGFGQWRKKIRDHLYMEQKWVEALAENPELVKNRLKLGENGEPIRITDAILSSQALVFDPFSATDEEKMALLWRLLAPGLLKTIGDEKTEDKEDENN